MKTLGIDPGSSLTGFGIIDEKTVFEYGCLRVHNSLTDLYEKMNQLIEKHKPEAVAVEKLFFMQNVNNALRIGEARGVILLCAGLAGLKIAEYSPTEVKMAITGYGRADKFQMQHMVKSLLKLEDIPRPDDAADALAIAICHLNSYKIKELAK